MTIDEAMIQIRDKLLLSVEENFRQSGRPRWIPSRREEVTNVSKFDKKTRQGKTLIDTSTLKGSIQAAITGYQIEIGTSVNYARIHQYGGNIQKSVQIPQHQRRIYQAFGKPITPKSITVRPHTRNLNIKIPARPFILLQDYDWKQIHKFLSQVVQDEIK